MVFQNYALYPHKTVAANIAFALKMARMSKVDTVARVDRAADILGLKPCLDGYPRALSGMQRQRVAMGRATVRNSQVFLFDAPLSNLDAKLRVQMRTEIRLIGWPAMNLVKGVVAADGSLAGAGVVLAMQRQIAPGRKVTFGIRPEHLLLTETGLPATVVVVQPTGSEIHLVLRAGDQDMTAVIRERHRFAPGQTVHVTPEAGMEHLFDTATGERI